MNLPNLKLKAEQALSMDLHSMAITCSLIGEFDSLNKVKKTGILSFTADISRVRAILADVMAMFKNSKKIKTTAASSMLNGCKMRVTGS